jgi:hypothetical protein
MKVGRNYMSMSPLLGSPSSSSTERFQNLCMKDPHRAAIGLQLVFGTRTLEFFCATRDSWLATIYGLPTLLQFPELYPFGPPRPDVTAVEESKASEVEKVPHFSRALRAIHEDDARLVEKILQEQPAVINEVHVAQEPAPTCMHAVRLTSSLDQIRRGRTLLDTALVLKMWHAAEVRQRNRSRSSTRASLAPRSSGGSEASV